MRLEAPIITVKFSTDDAGDDSIAVEGADDGATTITVTVVRELDGASVTRQASFSPPEVNIHDADDRDHTLN